MSIRLVFTGDIAFSRYFRDGWKQDGILSPEIEDYLRGADHVVANVECVLTDKEFRRKGSLLHACDPEAGAFLKKRNMSIWSLANNHMLDCGAPGIDDTLRAAADNGCRALGAGADLDQAARPLIVGEEVKVGILALARSWTYIMAEPEKAGVLTWDKTELIRSRIRELRKSVDWVVLIVHGGDEYADLSMPYIRKRYRKLLSYGADIIVGHHPHVVQQYERVGDKLIVYSLGNFIFDTDMQRQFRHTDRGVLLGITLDRESFTFDHLATRINREKHTVEAGETPAVFCEVNEAEYQRLWPLAAKTFYKEEAKRWLLIQKKPKKAPKLSLLIHNAAACRHDRMRTILKGRLTARAGAWKESALQDVCGYLQEK